MQAVRLSDVVSTMLSDGVHPTEVRRRLANQGIRWRYGYTVSVEGRRHKGAVGTRERARNLKRLGLKPCGGCGQGFELTVAGDVCPGCLIEKWAPPAR